MCATLCVNRPVDANNLLIFLFLVAEEDIRARSPLPTNFDVQPSPPPYRDTHTCLSCRDRAACDELQNLPLPLSEDSILVLSSDAIDCAVVEDDQLEEFVIEGGTLTLTGPSTTT